MSYDLDCVFAVSFWFLKHLANFVVCQHTAHIDVSKLLKMILSSYSSSSSRGDMWVKKLSKERKVVFPDLEQLICLPNILESELLFNPS